ncbi:MAG TPA: hypothetical protein PLK28_15130 [Candidatus Rifleibacterium sp.]|nr:hypothetical protein [Candidatus Rifleibacterium sp.]
MNKAYRSMRVTAVLMVLISVPAMKASLTVGVFDGLPVNKPGNNESGLWQKAA